MPAVIPFIPLIAAGVGVGGSLLTQRSANNAARDQQQRAENSPTALAQRDLIQHQTEVGRWGFGQAQSLLPQAKQAIDLPFSHFKSLLSGDPDEFNKVLAGSNQAIDQQTQSTRRNISQFAPRGMVAQQLASLSTGNAQAKQGNYFSAYLNALSGAQGSATQYGNLFNSLLASGQGSAVPALSALTSNLGFQTQRDLQSQQLNAQAMSGLGSGLGSILAALLLRTSNTSRANSTTSTSGTSSAPNFSPGGGFDPVSGTWVP